MACSGLMVDMRYFRFGSLLLLLPLLMGADLRMAQRALTNRNYLIALRQFTELAEQNPNWSAAHLGRAQALAGMGRCETALETLQAFRQSKAWTAKAAYAEGRCWQQQGDYSQARVAYEESVRLRPTLALGWYGLATVHAYGQDLPAMHLAIEELDSLVHVLPVPTAHQ